MRTIITLLLLAGVSYATESKNEVCKKVVDIAMVVDDSGSIKLNNFDLIKTFLETLVTRFSVASYGAHFGLVQYGTEPKMVFPLDKYTDTASLQRSIRNMSYRAKDTYTGKAFEYTRKNLFKAPSDRQDVPNVLILFSDGKSYDHPVAVRQANLMKAEGVEILCVGIGKAKLDSTLRAQLKSLASKPDYLFETVFGQLITIVDSLTKTTCEAVDPCSGGTCLNNGICSVVGGNTYKCTCKVGYSGTNCETEVFIKKGCRSTKDIVRNEELFNRRDLLTDYVWNAGWDQFLDKNVQDCYTAAKQNNYQYFWIEFDAECYGQNLDLSTMASDAPGTENCWGKRPDYKHCALEDPKPICIGRGNYGYIYQVVY